MDIVIDTSALIAVIVGESQKKRIIELTTSHTLIAPGSIPWEVGNAFSAMFKKGRISLKQAQEGFEIFNTIPIRYIQSNFVNVLTIAHKINMYAYYAYFLDCALRLNAPLLTLDAKLIKEAKSLSVITLEV